MRLTAGSDWSEQECRVLDLIDTEVIGRDVLDLVSIPSETGDEAAVVKYYAGLLEREGLVPQWDEAAPGRHNLYARIPGGSPDAGRSLMLHGHMDTIPISGRWPPVRDGDWAYHVGGSRNFGFRCARGGAYGP